jgi:rubrerythrin
MPDVLKTKVTEAEARVRADDIVARWKRLDDAGREAFLNAVRFTEMRGGALLAYLAESIDDDRDARRNIMRQARDEAKHGYYFSLILEHLGYEEHPGADVLFGYAGSNPNDFGGVDEEVRVLTFMVHAEAIELRAAVTFDALNRIFADDPFVGRYLNEIRYDEMFHLGWIGSRLDDEAGRRPEINKWREDARDWLASATAKLQREADAAARERLAASTT